MNAPASTATALPATVAMPTLGEGELYAGLVLENGLWHHVILLEGESSPLPWKKAMAKAKEQGADLPTRNELALLYANLREEFEGGWYWSSTPDAGDAAYAWYQHFRHGGQHYGPKGYELRARAVRRAAI